MRSSESSKFLPGIGIFSISPAFLWLRNFGCVRVRRKSTESQGISYHIENVIAEDVHTLWPNSYYGEYRLREHSHRFRSSNASSPNALETWQLGRPREPLNCDKNQTACAFDLRRGLHSRGNMHLVETPKLQNLSFQATTNLCCSPFFIVCPKVAFQQLFGAAADSIVPYFCHPHHTFLSPKGMTKSSKLICLHTN